MPDTLSRHKTAGSLSSFCKTHTRQLPIYLCFLWYLLTQTEISEVPTSSNSSGVFIGSCLCTNTPNGSGSGIHHHGKDTGLGLKQHLLHQWQQQQHHQAMQQHCPLAELCPRQQWKCGKWCHSQSVHTVWCSGHTTKPTTKLGGPKVAGTQQAKTTKSS